MARHTELWAPQEALRQRIMVAWEEGKPVVIQAGQRSGKTILAEDLVSQERDRRDQFVVIGPMASLESWRGAFHREYAAGLLTMLSNEQTIRRVVNTGYRDAPEWLKPGVIVIIEDCFWFSGAEAIFDRCAKGKCRVLAISSKGPHRWRQRDRIWRYSTAELNPHFTPEVVAQQKSRDQDPEMWERDFGNPEP